MSSRYAIVAVLITFVLMYFTLHSNFIGADNGGSAHGQQGVHLAIANGFVESNLDVQNAHAFALNSSNSHFETNPKFLDDLTASHFYIHELAVASIQSVFGGELAAVFHVYNLLWGFVGLLFLYLLSLRITQNIGKSLFVVVFFGTAPLLAFFQSSAYPIVAHVAFLLIGIYFVYRYLNDARWKFAIIGLSSLAFASLLTFDFVLFFVSGLALVLNHNVKLDRWNLRIELSLFLIITPILLWSHVFINQEQSFGAHVPWLFEDWKYDSTTPNFVFENWKMHYFTVFQTIVMLLIVVLFAIKRFRKALSKSELFHNYQIALIAVPGVLYAIVSPYQTMYSEVFFLKMLFPLIVFGVIFIVDSINIDWAYRYPKIAVPVFLFLLLMMIGEGNWTQMVRHEKARTSYGAEIAFAFHGGDELLAKYGVQAKDPLNVVIPEDSGIGFDALMHLKRNGLIREIPVQSIPAEPFPKGEYVVCTIPERDHLYAHFQTNFKELGNNGSIVLFKVVD